MISFIPEFIGENGFAYSASEDGKTLGRCEVSVNGLDVMVTGFVSTGNIAYDDGLIRCIASKATDYSAYFISVPGTYSAYVNNGAFKNEDGVLKAEIPDVLIGNCGCKSEEINK